MSMQILFPEFPRKSPKWPLWTLNAIKAIVGACLLQTKSLSVTEAYIRPQAVKALLAADVVETPNKFINEQWKAAQMADEVITQVLELPPKETRHC